MGLFDVFTGAPARRAAEQTRNYLGGLQSQVGGQITSGMERGLGALESGRMGGIGYFEPQFATARGDIAGSIPQATGALADYTGMGVNALRGGVGGGVGAIGAGTGAGINYLQGALDPALAAIRGGTAGALGSYDPLAQLQVGYGGVLGQTGDMVSNALGLQGPEGSAAARAAFQTSPGYTFNLDQGLEAINRAAAARGEAAGGNISRAAQTFGAGLASQEYNPWVRNLMGREASYLPFPAQLAQAGATGRAGAYLTGGGREADVLTGTGQRMADLSAMGGRDIANLMATGGAREADILRTTGAGLADIYGTGGRNLAGIAQAGGTLGAGMFGNEGTNAANLIANLTGQRTNFAGQIAQPYANTYTNEANAQMAGSGNLWNLIGGLGTMAAGGGMFNSLPGLGNLSSFLTAGAGRR